MRKDIRILRGGLQEAWGRMSKFERACIVAWIVGLIAMGFPQVPMTKVVVGLVYIPFIVAIASGVVRGHGIKEWWTFIVPLVIVSFLIIALFVVLPNLLLSLVR